MFAIYSKCNQHQDNDIIMYCGSLECVCNFPELLQFLQLLETDGMALQRV